MISAKTSAIHRSMILTSPRVREGNFTAIDISDLARLFAMYDGEFFAGWLTREATTRSGKPIEFRLSSTMTRAGGKMTCRSRRTPVGRAIILLRITIASRLLFLTFNDARRPVTVCGLVCTDRLMALQRIMEHEILHLLEMLVWEKSSCAGTRFKTLAARFFGHTGTQHDLVTPRERAAVEHAIHPGSLVEFEFQGRRLAGRVNRIHHRATVLIEAEDGTPYSNGKRYHKYYIPIPGLRVVPEKTPT